MTLPAADRPLAAPVRDAFTTPFFDAANQSRLLLRRCEACSQPHWYPRPVCPLCGSARTAWQEASGRGTVYSVTVTRHAPVPYAVAYVTLEEGPTMLTNIVDADLDSLRIGMAVTVTFKPAEDGSAIPMFRPG
ncbi:Zn-ribbon domain-containing OB-fold protein [Aquincola sp. J276]|uniref:Zn-ribbon domain-containing OB-fold protein n=1 Tax=Aquincola sp. J276 TaxID=2898432 RepID=UPI0021509A8D|nr:OB-fold domain-containing protein [Aquincola sp. J276]MCR5866199.1 OB-fold domain-containing protein [Aquincola sp. J276]